MLYLSHEAVSEIRCAGNARRWRDAERVHLCNSTDGALVRASRPLPSVALNLDRTPACPYRVVLVLGSSLIFGLPFTRFLRACGCESAVAYVVGGVALGFAVPVLVLLYIGAPSGYWIAILGGFSGGVTANTWWREAREPNVC